MQKKLKKTPWLPISWAHIRGLFPSALPSKDSDFDQFCSSIFKTYSLPDMPSYRHAIATMIMHLSPTVAFKSKIYFALSIRKAIANEIAYGKIREIRESEKAAETDGLQDPPKDVVSAT